MSRCRRPGTVTGAAADEYNLNVVDCNTSVTVARRSSISVSGVWDVCVFVTAGPTTKMFSGGEEESGGHVL